MRPLPDTWPSTEPRRGNLRNSVARPGLPRVRNSTIMSDLRACTWSADFNGYFMPFEDWDAALIENAYQRYKACTSAASKYDEYRHQHHGHEYSIYFESMLMVHKERGDCHQVMRFAPDDDDPASPSSAEAAAGSKQPVRPSDKSATEQPAGDGWDDTLQDSVAWERLVLAYDEDGNGMIDPEELVCLVRDALSLSLGVRLEYDIIGALTSPQPHPQLPPLPQPSLRPPADASLTCLPQSISFNSRWRAAPSGGGRTFAAMR